MLGDQDLVHHDGILVQLPNQHVVPMILPVAYEKERKMVKFDISLLF